MNNKIIGRISKTVKIGNFTASKGMKIISTYKGDILVGFPCNFSNDEDVITHVKAYDIYSCRFAYVKLDTQEYYYFQG